MFKIDFHSAIMLEAILKAKITIFNDPIITKAIFENPFPNESHIRCQNLKKY